MPASDATIARRSLREEVAREAGLTVPELRELEREGRRAQEVLDPLYEMTREELYELAKRAGVRGRSSMTKSELADEIAHITTKGEVGSTKSDGDDGRRSGPARGRRAATRAKRVAKRAGSGSFGQVVMLSLGLVVLYVVLNNAVWFAKALDGVSTALDWLGSPERAIPYYTPQEG